MARKGLELESTLWDKYSLIAGVDEVGRGALAGPIVVSAVVLPRWFKEDRIQDSKLLTPRQRLILSSFIKKVALSISTVFISVNEIEKKNPLQATKDGMIRAVKQLSVKPDLCLVDGQEKIVIEGVETVSIVAGDNKSINIAAASIVAKVTRDTFMGSLHELYPDYGWKMNKGYCDKKHLLALIDGSFCPLHRRNYEPIKSLIKSGCNKEALKKKYNL